MVGRYGVPGVNENGEGLIEVCVERRIIVGYTWFQKKKEKKRSISIHDLEVIVTKKKNTVILPDNI